jgi:AcrR family transcriptional regulator
MAKTSPAESDPRPGSAAWWHARAARPRRTSALTAERIVDAAIALLDAEGLDAFTMRRLADRLGTAAGSLYRHYESRDAVLVAVMDHVIGETLTTDAPGQTWAERAANLSRAQRRLLLRRPYLAAIWQTTEQLGPNALRGRERALQITTQSGLPTALAARAYLTLLHYTIGFATIEQSLGFRTPQMRRATRSLFRRLPQDEFPATRTLAIHLTEANLEQEFELGLQAIIAGLQALADEHAAA